MRWLEDVPAVVAGSDRGTRLHRGVPGGLPSLLTAGVDSCDRLAHGPGISASSLGETPSAGTFFWYLVLAENACGQGPAGNASPGPRILNSSGPCDPSCSDAAVDGFETDVDCGGGVCPACGNGKNCSISSDCTSRVCSGLGVCQAPTCTDAVQNGNETGVDCGGACAPCGTGPGCCSGTDCQSGSCSGGICHPAPNGSPCVTGSSCLSGNCVDGFCCDTGCTSTCQACSAAKKGSGANGTCGNIANGTDPDGECPGPAVCNGSGACISPNGAACVIGATCQSGNCVDGVCCNTACTGTCQACSAAKKGSGADGTCGNIANGTDPDGECSGPAVCNGSGACVSPNGSACVTGSTCQSGNCVDGFCCDTSCNGTCLACSAAKKGSGSNGTCGTIANGTDPDGECPGAAVCNGSGACASPNGAACTIPPNCISLNCVDGVCCNTPCNALCQACSAAKKGFGPDGTCGSILNGTDPDNECPGGATCNGAGGCN